MIRRTALLASIALACSATSGCGGLRTLSAIGTVAFAVAETAAVVQTVAEASQAARWEERTAYAQVAPPAPVDFRTVYELICPRGARYALLCPAPGVDTTCFFETSASTFECRTRDCSEGPPDELKAWCAAN
jgi:hypothetical protein